MASASSPFQMIHLADAPDNVDHHSYFTTTDHAAVGRLGSESFELRGSGGWGEELVKIMLAFKYL